MRELAGDVSLLSINTADLPRVGELLVPILEHIASAGVTANNVTLLCPPGGSTRR